MSGTYIIASDKGSFDANQGVEVVATSTMDALRIAHRVAKVCRKEWNLSRYARSEHPLLCAYIQYPDGSKEDFEMLLTQGFTDQF